MSFNEISNWVAKHETLITLVLLPIVFFILTKWIANRTDKQTAKDRAAERLLKREFNLAKFRLEALNEFRRDFSEFLSGLRNWRLTNTPSHEDLNTLYNKVFLQLDQSSNGFGRFVELSESLMQAPDFPTFAEGYEELKQIAASLLKEATTSIEASLEEVGSVA